jgi:hypothetical protein
VPEVLGLIIRSAFDLEPAFAGMFGMAVSWGVKRGVYSNEAGQGTAPHSAAAAEVSHPAKQGLVQAFSVYVDTLFVCTATAFMILFTGQYNVVKTLKAKLKSNQKYIEAIEIGLMNIVHQDEKINLNYRLITSIKGIGKINGLMTIAYTENFTSFSNPRSYAVYVGVVPFEHTSGTSIRGRKRVSHIANKELKQELNQAARSALEWDQEMKNYGDRMMKRKCYKIVLNNIKFKLILRMFAVVRNGEMYVDNYRNVA